MGDGRGRPESLRCEFPDSPNLFEKLKSSLQKELSVLQFHQTRDEPPKFRASTGDCEITITNRSDLVDTGVIEIKPRQ
jgi:hypothetical protein